MDCVASMVGWVWGSLYGGRRGYGCGAYAAGGHNFLDQDLYKDHLGPDQHAGGYSGTYDGGYARGCCNGYGVGDHESELCQQRIDLYK